ncbi:MAG: tRNA pseudouridine(55) synthase TruB, partial [Betaproteobacteria bacterium]
AKAGHTGTLDPLATGLLPLCFGEATKFSADLLDADKTYVATLKLGLTTDSGDAEGEITSTRPVNCGEVDLQALLPRFTGDIEQVPPMHSALKRDGRPLYELARQGITVERQPRAVTIHAIELLAFAGDEATLRVSCSKGTYIRSLAMDLGEALGCGAHLIALRRTEVADLKVDRAVTLEALEPMSEADRLQLLSPVDALLQSLPRVDLEGDQRFGFGNPVAAPAGIIGKCRVYNDGTLIGLGEVRDGLEIWPKRLVQLAI